MTATLCETPAGLVAVVLAAKRTGDRVLEASARDELRKRFGITIKIEPPANQRPKAAVNA